jgi:hypothetical protein
LTFQRKQLFVSALFENLSVMKHQNPVRHTNG